MIKKYYVYLHKRKDNGVVFYVGKGSGERYKRTKRYKNWQKIYNEAGGFYSEIYKENISENEALELETELITNPSKDWCLVNQRKSFSKLKPSVEDILKFVEYDESSQTCLRHVAWNRSRIKKTARYKGDVAGYIMNRSNPPEYYTLKILGIPILGHHVVWMIHNGNIPDGFVINHKNNNSLDNRIINLELVTQAVNCRRKSIHKKSTTGVRVMTVKEHKYAVCCWTNVDGKRSTKLFSFLEHGEELAVQLASELRKQKIADMQSIGYEILQN